jgi:hypothetical protein
VARVSRSRSEGKSVRLKPADPFELVRLLARSQSDPRKAVAELVQNSLDAGAREVIIERVRQRGVLALTVRDDGEGVLPDRERETALQYIATNIGHSHKLGLGPSERASRVVAGQYGVGLLGFWAIGGQMELRSRVKGSDLLALCMQEDSPDARIRRLPLRTDCPETFTEVVISPVHDVAQKALAGRRLCDYLASELRGQILAHSARVIVLDRIARGLAQKEFLVTPRRFVGERLEVPDTIPVPDFAALRIELYLARGAERPMLHVACAGTIVADDIAELSALGLNEKPWVGADLVGQIDFPSFSVPPGTRRGVAPDRAAIAFVHALERLRPLVLAELERLDSQRRAAADREIVKDLQRALRGLRKHLPQYDLPEVADGVSGARLGCRDSAREAEEGGALGPASSETPSPPAGDPLPLFPPGPLASVRIVPEEIAVAPGNERRARAVALDEAGARINGVELEWELQSAASGITLRGETSRPAIVVRAEVPLGTRAELRVRASAGERMVQASAGIVCVAESSVSETLGVPEPHMVSDADGRWRSRMLGQRWEVNEAHADYLALRAEPRARVRYLLSLLAKEIVLRTSGRPEVAEVLESLVEVLAHAERNLRGA